MSKKEPMSMEEYADRMNGMTHGQFITYRLMQEVIGQFLALSKHARYLSVVDYLEKNFSACEDFKLLKYFGLLAMFIKEFKKLADTDPAVKAVLDASERAAFMQAMGGPKV